MKKILSMLMICTMLFALAACGNGGQTPGSSQEAAGQPSEPAQESAQGTAGEGSAQNPENGPESSSAENALVVYFSATGNTKSVAETLAAATGADLHEIVPQQPYTDEDLDYNDNSSRTTKEQNDEDARPEIAGSIDGIENYDVIYVGFPIWWGDMPRILYTFFDAYDLSGKTIAPFCTSGGSGISGALQSIEELEPSATVTDGLRAGTSDAEDDISRWLNDIGLAA